MKDVKELKEHIALACRIIAAEGYEDMQMGHISARHPERHDWVLIKRAGMALEEVMSGDDVITIDWEGNVVEGGGPVHGEWPIHTEVYRRRNDIHAVVHAHPVYVTAISLTKERFGPAGQPGGYFPDGVATHDDIDVITTVDQARAMVEAMGNHKVVVLKSHGVVVGGESVEEACVAAVLLERAARIQWIARTFGEIDWPELEKARAKRVNSYSPRVIQGRWDYLVRRQRRLDKQMAV